MPKQPKSQQYIVLPAKGALSMAAMMATPGSPKELFLALHSKLGARVPQKLPGSVGPPISLRVLDSIHEDGAKLIESELTL